MAGRVVVAPDTGIANLFSGELTPQRALAILHTAAHGAPRDQHELFDTMLETDGHLRSVWATRRLAVTGLDWELVPANEVGKNPRVNEDAAGRVRDYCADAISEIDGLEGALCHLNEAVGIGTAAAELVWDKGVPVAIEPIEHVLLQGDMREPRRLRIATDEDHAGILPDEFPGGKFIVHTPESLGGSRFRGGLLRAAILNYMAKRFGRKWWFVCLELFGMPITIAKYGDGETPEVKQQMLDMIKSLGIARGGIFPSAAEVQLVEYSKKGGEWPYGPMMEYLDSELSKEFLGQTLTTQMDASAGSFAATKVHDDVRADLRDDDIRKEGSTIREQLLVPMAVYKFGEEGRRNAPYFRRVIEESKDLLASAGLASIAVNELGAEINGSFIEDELGLRLSNPSDRNRPLPGRRGGFGSAFGDLSASRVGGHPPGCRCGRQEIELVGHGVLRDIARRRGTAVAKAVGWVFSAVIASSTHTANVMAAISEVLADQSTLQQSLDDLPAAFASLPIDDMIRLENELIAASLLAGRAHARGKVTANAAGRAGNGIDIQAHAEINFEKIPFVQAVESLQDRLGLRPEDFEALDAQARSRAWRVAGVWNMQLLAMVHRELVASIAAGETSRDFRNRVPFMAERNGWSGENPWHADIVQYQNFAMGHAAGRLTEYRDFGVNAWRFVANGPSCPICDPLIGKVFAMSDRRFFPPLHFWCDCEDEPMFDDEFNAAQVTRSGDVNNPDFDQQRAQPKGFRWDPAEFANLEPLKMSGFPDQLKPAFRAFAEAQGWEIEE
jgi:phage gp29-like protein